MPKSTRSGFLDYCQGTGTDTGWLVVTSFAMSLGVPLALLLTASFSWRAGARFVATCVVGLGAAASALGMMAWLARGAGRKRGVAAAAFALGLLLLASGPAVVGMDTPFYRAPGGTVKCLAGSRRQAGPILDHPSRDEGQEAAAMQ